jgi:hypothetical protein
MPADMETGNISNRARASACDAVSGLRRLFFLKAAWISASF